MIFGRTSEEILHIESGKTRWHKWYAWYPVMLNNNQWAWLETIERKYYSQTDWAPDCPCDITVWDKEYRICENK